MNYLRKFVPLAAIAALAFLAFGLNGDIGQHSAQAAATGLTADNPDLVSGDSTGLSASFTASTADIAFSTSGLLSGTVVTIHIDSCVTSPCTGVTNQDTDAPGVSKDNLTDVFATLTVTCDADDTFVVHVTQSVSQAQTMTCSASGGSGNITITKKALDDTTKIFTFTAPTSNPGSACEGSFTLRHNQTKAYTCPIGDFSFTESVPSGWSVSDISCIKSGTALTTWSGDPVSGTLSIHLASTTHTLDCTFTDVLGLAGTPTAITGTASSIGMTVLGNSTLGCSGSTFISVVVKDAAGNALNGVTVNLATSLGTISPTSQATIGGGVLAVFTAPATGSGTATVTASATGLPNSTTPITVTCTTTTTQPTAVPAQPTAVPPPAQTSVVRPPSTGDAGLMGSGNGSSSWLLIAGIGLLSATGLGAIVAVRSRA